MFKKHPSKDTIRFIVLPIVREILGTTNDLAMEIEDTMFKYGPDQEICEGIQFDFSLLMLYG